MSHRRAPRCDSRFCFDPQAKRDLIGASTVAKGARLVDLPVQLDEELHDKISSLTKQTGRPMEKLVKLALSYGVLLPLEDGKKAAGRRLVAISISKSFDLALRRMEIRTPAARGRLARRGLPLAEGHLKRLPEYA